jgi:uncharacterized protein with beta-barrel porin domain
LKLDTSDLANSDVFVHSGATLTGVGTMKSLHILSGGCVRPGNSPGNPSVVTFTSEAGSCTEIEVISSSPAAPVAGTDYDQFDVSGTATVNGGEVKIIADPPTAGSYDTTDDYIFLEIAGGGSLTVNTPFSFSDNITGLRAVGSYTAGAGGKYQFSFEAFDYLSDSITSNQHAMGGYLNYISDNMAIGGTLSNRLTAIENLAPANKRRALDELTGQIYGSLASVQFQNTSNVLHLIHSRIRPAMSAGSAYVMDSASDAIVRGQCESGACGNWIGWTAGYALTGSAGGDPNTQGFDYDLYGGMLGVERPFADCGRMGLFYSYGDSFLQTGNYAGQASSTNHLWGGFLSWEDPLGYGIFNGGLGYDKYQATRTMTVADTATVHGSTDGWQAFLYGERGATFSYALADFQPFCGLQYVFQRQNRFSEGGDTPFLLEHDGMEAGSLRTLLGARLLKSLVTRQGRGLTVEAHTHWMHELLDQSSGMVNARFTGMEAGNAFTTYGANLGRDWVIAGTSGTWAWRQNVNLFAQYNVQFNRYQTFHAGDAGVQILW